MFKALKGKAAGALEAAASSGGGGDPAALAALEGKLKDLTASLEKKDGALQKVTLKMKKMEEKEQRLLGDMQKKDAEINKLTKQLEKFRVEGAGAGAAMEEAMGEVKKELEAANAKLAEANESNATMTTQLNLANEGLSNSEALANSSTALQVELDLQNKAIFIQEDKFKARITTILRQLEVAERKVMNAKYLSESHEQLSAEAQMRQIASENKATETDRRLQRSLERYASLEHDLTIEKLTNQCHAGRTSIKETEQSIRECYSDPLLKVPAGTGKRRQLKKLEDKLVAIRLAQKSQSEFLTLLTTIGDCNEEIRTAANNSDAASVKRLMKQGVSVNEPDTTGFSAFKYACGTGNMEIIRLMLDDADIQDEDGRMTALILAGKNAHDDVVRLLVQRGALIDATDVVGRTALHVACDNGNRSTALELLDLGANVNAIDKKNNTSLHYCAQKNYAPIARLLLDRGIDPKALNVDGLTAAKIAMEKKNQRVIEVLTENSKRLEEERQARNLVVIDSSEYEKSLLGVAGSVEGFGGGGGETAGGEGRGGGERVGRRRSSVGGGGGGGKLAD